MTDKLVWTYNVSPDNFISAGEASSDVKRLLRQLGAPKDVIRKVSIAMYEGEINMVIHAKGGVITVTVDENAITMVLKDSGPGIPDVEKAMQAGFSTAREDVRNLGFGAGMGLPNMKSNSDEMTIDTELGVGTTVTMKVYI